MELPPPMLCGCFMKQNMDLKVSRSMHACRDGGGAAKPRLIATPSWAECFAALWYVLPCAMRAELCRQRTSSLALCCWVHVFVAWLVLCSCAAACQVLHGAMECVMYLTFPVVSGAVLFFIFWGRKCYT
jgi:hypothetical protein